MHVCVHIIRVTSRTQDKGGTQWISNSNFRIQKDLVWKKVQANLTTCLSYDWSSASSVCAPPPLFQLGSN